MQQVCEYNFAAVIAVQFILGVRVSSGQCLTYTGPIISHLSCTGRESNWKDCALGSVGSVNCGYDKAAVISCLNGEERALSCKTIHDFMIYCIMISCPRHSIL